MNLYTLCLTYLFLEVSHSIQYLIPRTELKEGPDKGRAPRFIQPIVPQTILEEEVVIMEAEVDSMPICSFQWYHNDLPIKVSQEINVYLPKKSDYILA